MCACACVLVSLLHMSRNIPFAGAEQNEPDQGAEKHITYQQPHNEREQLRAQGKKASNSSGNLKEKACQRRTIERKSVCDHSVLGDFSASARGGGNSNVRR